MMALLMSLMLVPSTDAPPNPWKERVAAAVLAAERTQSPADYAQALDAAHRADDWEAGLRMADAASARHPGNEALAGLSMRAFWRGGRFDRAQEILERQPSEVSDRAALASMIPVLLSRGERRRAEEIALRLKRLPDLSALELAQIIAARVRDAAPQESAVLARRAQAAAKPSNGYPEIYFGEMLDGFAEFLAAVGEEPLNRIEQAGHVEMKAALLVNLPICEAKINGYGPYRLVIDTGGSNSISLDDEVAEEIGFKSLAKGSVRGVAGAAASGMGVLERVQLGTIDIRRAMARTFGVRQAMRNMADGILGTGVFEDGRMTLDFRNGQLIVAASSPQPADGVELEIRVVGDAKLLAPFTLNGEYAVALLDSGANVAALSTSRMRRLFPDDPGATIRNGIALGVGTEKGPDLTIGRGVTFAIAGKTYENYSGMSLDVLDQTISPMIGVQIDAIIGMSIFRDTNSITVDYATARAWVDWLQPS